MAKHNVEKEIKRLNKILSSNFSYEEDLQALGKFLFDNLPDVEGIVRGIKKSYPNGLETDVPVITLKVDDIVIWEDGNILSTIGSRKIKTSQDLSNMLWTINDYLEEAADLSKYLKKALKLIEKSIK